MKRYDSNLIIKIVKLILIFLNIFLKIGINKDFQTKWFKMNELKVL